MNRTSLWLVSLLVFTIPWENVIVFGGDTTIARYVGYGVMTACIVSFARTGLFRTLSQVHFLIFGFISYAALSNAWTIDGASSLQSTVTEFQLFVMAILIWQVAATTHNVQHLMRAYVLGGCISIVCTIQSFLSHSSTLYERYMAGAFDPNDLALTLVISIPIACFLAHQSRRAAWTVLYYVYIGAVLFAIGLTASRGGALAALVSLTILPLTWIKRVGRRRLSTLVFGVVVVATILFYIPSPTWQRLSTINEEFMSGTLNNRTVAWDAGLNTFESHPFFGVGIGSFRSAVSAQIPDGMVAHNTFLSVLVECGAFGTLVFVTIIVCLIKVAWCMRRDIRTTWIVLFLSTGIGISALSWLDRKPLWFAIAIALAHASAAPIDTAKKHVCLTTLQPQCLLAES
jgi:O-antigen ligase